MYISIIKIITENMSWLEWPGFLQPADKYYGAEVDIVYNPDS